MTIRKYSEIQHLDHGWNAAHTEKIYKCPFCIQYRGKPDHDGKLYYSPSKGKGYCFKCRTVIIDDTAMTMEKLAERMRTHDSTSMKRSDELWDVSWMEPIDDHPDAVEYLTKTRKIPDDYLSLINFRYVPEYDYIALPSCSKDDTLCHVFQLANWKRRGSGASKYLTVGESGKTLWGDFTLAGKSTVVIAEGIMSAISAHCLLNIPDSGFIALLGKSMSPVQQYLIKSSPSISRVILALDGGTYNEIKNIAKRLTADDLLCEVILLDEGRDPNDYLVAGEKLPNPIEFSRTTVTLINKKIKMQKSKSNTS